MKFEGSKEKEDEAESESAKGDAPKRLASRECAKGIGDYRTHHGRGC